MGYSDSSSSVGSPSLGLGEDLIATILDLLQAGWRAVVASGELNAASHEPDIAGRLGREMLAEKRRRKIRNLRFEEEVGTRSSLDATKVEGRIDIKVIYSFDEEEYFGIECKRVSSRKADGLAREYVKKGVARFVTEKYSPGHNWAAMVGFVIDGKVSAAVDIVVEAIASKRDEVRLKEDWVAENRFGSIKHLYTTRHEQIRCRGCISILHLFLNLN